MIQNLYFAITKLEVYFNKKFIETHNHVNAN